MNIYINAFFKRNGSIGVVLRSRFPSELELQTEDRQSMTDIKNMNGNTTMVKSLTTAVTFFLLLSMAKAKKVMSAREKRAFMKAMEPNKFGDGRKIMQNLVARAKPANERKLADQEDQYQNYAFDMSQYSIKYAGCQSVLTWSDEQAEDEESETVFTPKRFVVFRLCPTNSCNQYSVNGCSSDFGEYLIQLDDYIDVVSEYYETKYQNYCAYCQPCYQDDDNGRRLNDDAVANDDVAAAANDDAAAVANDDAAAAANDDAAEANDDGAAEEDAEACDEENCADSYDYCYYDDDNVRMDVREFLGCIAVEDDNGNDYYLSPHCSNDGFSVKMGVFSDEDCMNYVGDEISVYDILGFDLDSAGFQGYFPRDCTSCLEAVSYILTKSSSLGLASSL